MATHKHPATPDPRLPGEAEIARIYGAGPQTEPPAALDHKILAAAQQAVQTPKQRAAFGTRWAIPASVAAVMLLSLGVLLQMQDPGLPEPDAPAPAPMEASPPGMTRNDPVQSPDRRLSKVQPASPPAAAKIAEGMLTDKVESKEKRQAQVPEPAASQADASVARERRAEQSNVGALEETFSVRRNALQEADTMNIHADVTGVRTSGQAGAYEFNVTLRSPDSGCQRYADWWEVVSEEGKLLYRRVLLHSHVQEQPFTRSGGPVPIQPTTRVWVRAHMNTGGYGGSALLGSVQAGFAPATPEADFAAGLATQAPLPAGCDF
jgi:hypothetical protein